VDALSQPAEALACWMIPYDLVIVEPALLGEEREIFYRWRRRVFTVRFHPVRETDEQAKLWGFQRGVVITYKTFLPFRMIARVRRESIA